MSKLIRMDEAATLIPDGATVMFGGFMGCGSPHDFIDILVESGVRDLTLICNDAAMPGGPMDEAHYGVAKLIHSRQVKRLIATHVGLNPEVAEQSMVEGTLEVLLVPQGSLVEMGDLGALWELLTAQGWTMTTAVCTLLFALFHWPCSTTCWTIYKETGSARWTSLAVALPTALGLALCFAVASVSRLLGL